MYLRLCHPGHFWTMFDMKPRENDGIGLDIRAATKARAFNKRVQERQRRQETFPTPSKIVADRN